VIEVIAFESGKFWAIEIPALEGMTQALIRDEIETMAFDYYECQTGLKADPSNFKFTLLEAVDALSYSRKVRERFNDRRVRLLLSSSRSSTIRHNRHPVF
jgi:hypothetical protein